jgi:CBS domain containing-hemolysin-like protein
VVHGIINYDGTINRTILRNFVFVVAMMIDQDTVICIDIGHVGIVVVVVVYVRWFGSSYTGTVLVFVFVVVVVFVFVVVGEKILQYEAFYYPVSYERLLRDVVRLYPVIFDFVVVLVFVDSLVQRYWF